MKARRLLGRQFWFVPLLFLISFKLHSQPPQRVSPACAQGQILGAEHNQSIVICFEAGRTPEVRTQVKRLNELADGDPHDRRAIENFVQRINATAVLLKDRNDELAHSVSKLLAEFAQHSDGKLIEQVATLTEQMQQLETEIDRLQRDPKTATKVRESLAGGVGENLAALRPDSASRVLEAIGLLDKKIDDLAVRIDCNSATPEAMAVAIKGRALQRTISIWHCRPENTATTEVQTSFVLLFTSREFSASEPFLDQLIAAGFNPLKEIKPLDGPLTGPATGEAGPLLARYFYAPVLRPLQDGNVQALKWLIANAPAGYWNGYTRLMEDIPKIMRLPWAPISGATAAEAISLLRRAGVPADTDSYKAFREAYKNWLATQLPDELRSPTMTSNQSPTTTSNQMMRIFASQMGYSRSPRPPQPGERDLWEAVSDALAPGSEDALHKARSEAIAEMTENDLQAAKRLIEQANDQLSQSRWWRKLPETPSNLEEAARRQAINAFDTFGYVPVAQGDLRDDDVARNQFYPNCNCLTVKVLRDEIAKASQRRDSILRFRSTYSNQQRLSGKLTPNSHAAR